MATSRSVNGACCSRTRRTGRAPRRTSMRAPGRKVDRAAAVAPQDAGALGVGQHLDGEHRRGRHHHRSGEQRVGAQRDHQQGLDLGPHHRAAGAEVVGGRPGRGGADDAVAAPPRQRASVDLDDDLEHALARGLLDARLVEGEGGEPHLLAHQHADVEGEPVLGGVVARDDGGDRGLDVLLLGLGEESHVAEVDPQQRGARRMGQLGRAEDRAVATDDQHQLAALTGLVVGTGRLRRARRRRPVPRSAASSASSRTAMPCAVRLWTHARATSRASARPVWASTRTRRWGLWVRSRVHPLTRHPHRPGALDLGADRRPRRSRPDRDAAGGRTRRCRRVRGAG